jgi:hypothetical protein
MDVVDGIRKPVTRQGSYGLSAEDVGPYERDF